MITAARAEVLCPHSPHPPQREYHALSGKNQTERIATFKGSGDFIFGGVGKYVEKGLHDGKPAWQWSDDQARTPGFGPSTLGRLGFRETTPRGVRVQGLPFPRMSSTR